MKILYERSFLKDVKKIKDDKLKKSIERIIERVRSANSKADLTNVKKLRGSDIAYKIRIGEYRMGIFIEADSVIFSRFLHRKDIYKKFP